MELRNLITFIHVAELGSFTKAAEQLGYSQSTISFQIKQLEDELGCLLFERVNHTITLTETSIRYGTLVALAVFSIPAEEMEADGERRLRETVILKEELKFREGRSDWGDICMGVGFYRDLFPKDESPLGRWKSGIWLEFTPEREDLLRKAFPQAQYRTPKRYSAPPNRN